MAMRKFTTRLIRYFVVLAVGIIIGHFVSENAFSERKAAELLYIRENDATAIQNQIYTTSFEMFPRCGAKAELPWFAGEYQAFDKTYKKFEGAINHQSYATADQEADVVRFRLIPYVEEFIRNVKSRDMVYKDERLKLLNHRLDSLKALDHYIRKNHDPKAYDEYGEHDVAIQKMVKENPMLITAGSLPPAGAANGNGMVKQNTYFGKGSGYTMQMINALKFNNESKIDELLGGGFIYAIPEYTPLQVTIPQRDKNYSDMYFVQVLDGYLKGVKGYVSQEHVLLF